MFTFSFFMICILGMFLGVAIETANALYTFYKHYKYINSPEFKSYIQALSKKERLTCKYNQFTRLTGGLFFLLVSTFILNAPVWVALAIAAILILILYQNSKISKALGRNY